LAQGSRGRIEPLTELADARYRQKESDDAVEPGHSALGLQLGPPTKRKARRPKGDYVWMGAHPNARKSMSGS
jgi:hypothetical protein